jgi:putative membrane protein
VVTTPIGVRATAEHGSTVASGLVPAVLAVALWLGTAMMFLTRGAAPAGPAWAQAAAGRRVLWGWLPALAVGAAQAALLVGLIVLSGSPVHSPVGLSALCALGVLTFAAINQALVSAFGGIGRLLTVALVLLESAAFGGLIPIQTAPGLVQSLNQVLPLSQFVNGTGQLILGGASGGLIKACAVLVLWTAGALIVSTLTTARRHPQLASRSLPPAPSPVPVPAAEPT